MGSNPTGPASLAAQRMLFVICPPKEYFQIAQATTHSCGLEECDGVESRIVYPRPKATLSLYSMGCRLVRAVSQKEQISFQTVS